MPEKFANPRVYLDFWRYELQTLQHQEEYGGSLKTPEQIEEYRLLCQERIEFFTELYLKRERRLK